MKRRCVVLLSGGLDSMLAIRIMQEQGIEVEALNFKTIFTCCQDQAGQTAADLGVRLTVVGQEDDYLDLIKRPQFGYGKGANPCVDCRIYMFEKAKTFMEQMDAHFIVSGEVVGQRPMSQKRGDLRTIAHHSKLDDLLLRPLSAKLLPPTLPEREGWVDREKLYGISGRSRKKLLQLAEQFGLQDVPTPSTGFALKEPMLSKKVFDLIQIQPQSARLDYELLKIGRHYRFDDRTKIILGRNETENDQLAYAHQLPDAASTAVLQPHNFQGPLAMITGPASDDAIHFSAALMLRYARSARDDNAQVELQLRGSEATTVIPAQRDASADRATTVAS